MVKSGRIALIDELRGLALLNMIVYHFLYDITAIYHSGPKWMFSSETDIWQIYICISFISIAGICIPYSKTPLKHGIIVLACGVVISLVTYAYMPEMFIVFGILHLIGISILLYIILKRPIERMNNIAGFIISVILALITWNVMNGYIGFGDLTLSLPIPETNSLAPLGITTSSFSSADFFPLLPYFFVFTAGVFLSDWVKRWPLWTRKTHIRPLQFVGQHTLLIYLAHQPIILSCLYLYYNFILQQ